MFTKNCQQCHQIAGQGTVIGPQLDGIGERGMERLIEDVLDPNRNVDPISERPFILKDGRVLSGLFRRQEGKKTVIAESTGKETSFDENQVEQKQPSANSLMPSNVGSTMPESEFYDLLAYLLSQRTREPRAARNDGELVAGLEACLDKLKEPPSGEPAGSLLPSHFASTRRWPFA